MRFRLKRNDQIGLILFIAFVASTILIYEFEEKFDREKWKNQPSFRYEMVEDIIDNELLLDKTKTEVISLLGKPNDSYSDGKNYFVYYLGSKPSFSKEELTQLVLVFENNRVIKATEELR
ncbi:hypothetical protein DFQ11_101489 [Winogradskyella epiphytica]|uniref:Uncharacterized protein n=1 Tax=Winogradskyella epiphytica TaxID=262005 RepID=A0A2V4X054_9FLAO|nr:hypothetical protein [Winogradskyella epiphytica]PYE83058.1 hypothetical protein DFQ11_101489 [Winogradskyella epiphytica]GGW55491.1 hypothetical protein GCM10008085_03570 [Winogradskyella epiphytica]